MKYLCGCLLSFGFDISRWGEVMEESTKIKILEVVQFPKKLTNNLLPWYRILPRVIFWVPMVTTLHVFLLFYAVGWGWDNAKDLYEELGFWE